MTREQIITALKKRQLAIEVKGATSKRQAHGRYVMKTFEAPEKIIEAIEKAKCPAENAEYDHEIE